MSENQTQTANKARLVINLLWQALIFTGQCAAWIIIPLAGLAFAQHFTSDLDLNSGHGGLAAVATYIVAIIASVRGAIRTSNYLKSFSDIKW